VSAGPAGAPEALSLATAVTPDGPGAFMAMIHPEWFGGGGPHGGFVSATILRAMLAALDDPARPPRSLTLHFLSPPAAGPCRIAVTVERAGRSLSSLSARLEQEGAPRVLALGAFSVPWEAPVHDTAAPPDVPRPEDVPAPAFGSGDGAPRFFDHVEVRPTFGGFLGGGSPQVGGWINLRPPEVIDPPAVAFLLDAWWPAVFGLLDRPAGAPTIDLTVHFRRPLHPAPPDRPLLIRFTTRVVQDGFFEEDGELWGADGRLLAQSRQLGLLRV
jgi:acyl-CoA thioesterase